MKRCGLLSFRSLSARQNGGNVTSSSSSPSVGVTFMSPSSIHHIRSEHLFATSTDSSCASCVEATDSDSTSTSSSGDHGGDHSCSCCCRGWDCCSSPAFDPLTSELILQATSTAASTASATGLGGLACVGLLGRELKIQVVENEGCWFALDSAQLELCRRLERRGLCRQVRVDIIPTREVPPRLRSLMTPPAPCCRVAVKASVGMAPCPSNRHVGSCSTAVAATTGGGLAVSHTSFPTTRIDVSQLACQHRDKLVGGLLPPTTPPTVVTATVAAPISAIGRTVSSHVIKGYRQLEQEDDRTSTASDSGEEEDAAGGSTADSVDEQHGQDSDNDDVDSDFDVSGDENEDDDDDDDSDVGSTDCEWTNNSDNANGASDGDGDEKDGASDGALSGDDEKDCLL